MIELRQKIGAEEVTVYVVETPEDLDGFRSFVRAHRRCLAVDTETTGLDIYSDEFRCRLVQFGTRDQAWVLPLDTCEGLCLHAAIKALYSLEKIVMQNASYDLQVLDRCAARDGECAPSPPTSRSEPPRPARCPPLSAISLRVYGDGWEGKE